MFSCKDIVELNKSPLDPELKIIGDIGNHIINDVLEVKGEGYYLVGDDYSNILPRNVIMKVGYEGNLIQMSHAQIDSSFHSFKKALLHKNSIFVCGEAYKKNDTHTEATVWKINPETLSTEEIYSPSLLTSLNSRTIDIVNHSQSTIYCLSNVYSDKKTDNEFLISKIDTENDSLIWEKIYGFENTEDDALKLYVDAKEEMHILGNTIHNGKYSPRLIHINAHGDILWDKILSKEIADLEGFKVATVEKVGGELCVVAKNESSSTNKFLKISLYNGSIAENKILEVENTISNLDFTDLKLSNASTLSLLGTEVRKENKKRIILLSLDLTGEIQTTSTWGDNIKATTIEYFPNVASPWVIANVKMESNDMLAFIKIN